MKKNFFVKFYVFLADLILYNLFFLKKTHNNVPYHFKLKSNFVGQIWPFVLKGLRRVLILKMIFLFSKCHFFIMESLLEWLEDRFAVVPIGKLVVFGQLIGLPARTLHSVFLYFFLFMEYNF